MDPNNVQQALAALSKLGLHNLTVESLNTLHVNSPLERELRLMAEVRSYFQVAYKVSFLDSEHRVKEY